MKHSPIRTRKRFRKRYQQTRKRYNRKKQTKQHPPNQQTRKNLRGGSLGQQLSNMAQIALSGTGVTTEYEEFTRAAKEFYKMKLLERYQVDTSVHMLSPSFSPVGEETYDDVGDIDARLQALRMGIVGVTPRKEDVTKRIQEAMKPEESSDPLVIASRWLEEYTEASWGNDIPFKRWVLKNFRDTNHLDDVDKDISNAMTSMLGAGLFDELYRSYRHGYAAAATQTEETTQTTGSEKVSEGAIRKLLTRGKKMIELFDLPTVRLNDILLNEIPSTQGPGTEHEGDDDRAKICKGYMEALYSYHKKNPEDSVCNYLLEKGLLLTHKDLEVFTDTEDNGCTIYGISRDIYTEIMREVEAKLRNIRGDVSGLIEDVVNTSAKALAEPIAVVESVLDNAAKSAKELLKLTTLDKRFDTARTAMTNDIDLFVTKMNEVQQLDKTLTDKLVTVLTGGGSGTIQDLLKLDPQELEDFLKGHNIDEKMSVRFITAFNQQKEAFNREERSGGQLRLSTIEEGGEESSGGEDSEQQTEDGGEDPDEEAKREGELVTQIQETITDKFQEYAGILMGSRLKELESLLATKEKITDYLQIQQDKTHHAKSNMTLTIYDKIVRDTVINDKRMRRLLNISRDKNINKECVDQLFLAGNNPPNIRKVIYKSRGKVPIAKSSLLLFMTGVEGSVTEISDITPRDRRYIRCSVMSGKYWMGHDTCYNCGRDIEQVSEQPQHEAATKIQAKYRQKRAWEDTIVMSMDDPSMTMVDPSRSPMVDPSRSPMEERTYYCNRCNGNKIDEQYRIWMDLTEDHYNCPICPEGTCECKSSLARLHYCRMYIQTLASKYQGTLKDTWSQVEEIHKTMDEAVQLFAAI